MPWLNSKLNQPTTVERVVGGICYLTFGLAGIIYIIVSGRSGQSSFFRFHFLQSIVISIIGVLLNWAVGAFSMMAGSMLGMLGPEAAHWVSVGINFAIVNLGRAGFLLLIYGMIWSFLGKYAEVPFISNIVRRQM